jgi:hypothetical protein
MGGCATFMTSARWPNQAANLDSSKLWWRTLHDGRFGQLHGTWRLELVPLLAAGCWLWPSGQRQEEAEIAMVDTVVYVLVVGCGGPSLVDCRPLECHPPHTFGQDSLCSQREM